MKYKISLFLYYRYPRYGYSSVLQFLSYCSMDFLCSIEYVIIYRDTITTCITWWKSIIQIGFGRLLDGTSPTFVCFYYKWTNILFSDITKIDTYLRLAHSNCVHSSCCGLNSLTFKSACEFVAISYHCFGTVCCRISRWFFCWNSPRGVKTEEWLNLKSKKFSCSIYNTTIYLYN